MFPEVERGTGAVWRTRLWTLLRLETRQSSGPDLTWGHGGALHGGEEGCLVNPRGPGGRDRAAIAFRRRAAMPMLARRAARASHGDARVAAACEFPIYRHVVYPLPRLRVHAPTRYLSPCSYPYGCFWMTRFVHL